MSDEAKEIERLELMVRGGAPATAALMLAALARRLLEERDEMETRRNALKGHVDLLRERIASPERELHEKDRLLMDMRLPRDIVED